MKSVEQNKKEPVFPFIINERPDDMPFDQYKGMLKIQRKALKSYLRRGKNISHHPYQYNTKK